MPRCQGPVEDPGRRAGPKVPDEERKGIVPGSAGNRELKRLTRLIKLQRPASVPHPGVRRNGGFQAGDLHCCASREAPLD